MDKKKDLDLESLQKDPDIIQAAKNR